MTDLDVVVTLLRAVLGITFVAHGYNHGWGAGGLDGTARWFEGIGLRPARLHAAMSAYMEVAAGTAIVLGLLLPFAAAAGTGVMAVAAVTVHRKNGFFIFKDGYEYVMVLATGLVALAILGPGRVSLDHVLGIEFDGLYAGLVAAGLGIAGSALLLITCWRPSRVSS